MHYKLRFKQVAHRREICLLLARVYYSEGVCCLRRQRDLKKGRGRMKEERKERMNEQRNEERREGGRGKERRKEILRLRRIKELHALDLTYSRHMKFRTC